MSSSRARRVLLWTLSIFSILIIAAGIGVYFLADGYVRQIAGRKGSAELGRTFSIGGPIKVDWDWTAPDIHIGGIRLSNLPGAKDPDMVSIDQLNFHIKIWKLLEGQLNLPDIDIDKPTIILEERADKTKNWDFPALSGANAAAGAALPSKRGNVPIIGNLAIHNGTLIYRDATKNIDVKLDIDNGSGGGGEKGDFVISGSGSLQNQPFSIHSQAGSLGMLRDSGKPYPLNLKIQMGATAVTVDGTFQDPVKMTGVDARLEIKGDNLADLYYLVPLPIPPTPQYRLSGHLVKDAAVWRFENFKGQVGGSDLEGTLSYDASHERGYAKAELTSKLLDIKDLGGFIGLKAGSAPAAPEQTPEQAKAAPRQDDAKLLPNVPLDLTRLRATDLDVAFKSDKILAPGLPVNNLAVGFRLKDGDLHIDPFTFGIASGDISGAIELDGRKDIPHMAANLSITKLALKQFFAKTRFAPLAAGYIGGHFELAGDGKSLAEVLGASNGRVTVIMSGGSVSQLIIDAAGLDIGHAAATLITSDKPTPIRCAVGDFKVTDGVLNSNIFIIDTGVSNIVGEAHINLKDETIDAKITASPKSVTVTAHAPITISGPFRHPAIGIAPTEAAERGAVAAVMSVFLTPLAAVIPFIETGVGKDSDCADLIGEAKAHAAKDAVLVPAAPPSSAPAAQP